MFYPFTRARALESMRCGRKGNRIYGAPGNGSRGGWCQPRKTLHPCRRTHRQGCIITSFFRQRPERPLNSFGFSNLADVDPEPFLGALGDLAVFERGLKRLIQGRLELGVALASSEGRRVGKRWGVQ